jgi:hypothetical protein
MKGMASAVPLWARTDEGYLAAACKALSHRGIYGTAEAVPFVRTCSEVFRCLLARTSTEQVPWPSGPEVAATEEDFGVAAAQWRACRCSR